MKSVAIFASLVASAAAFAPAQQQSARSSVATNMAFEGELGAQPPLGFFDPLGLVSSGDQEKFDRLRFVEIKHGRIAMLAVAGYLVAESGIRLPGLISFDGTTFADIPNGFAALSAVPDAGVAQVFAFIGFMEVAVMKDVTGQNEFIGDFRNGFIDFGWDTFSADIKMKKRAIELNQGRAAQMGILALMVHEKLGVSLIPSA
jgi:Chlorophyll A-B binding protein